MSDESKLKEIIATGKDADSWLNHAQYRHAITLVKAELLSQFEKTKYKESDDREEIWRKLQALNGIVSRIERLVRDGKTAEKSLLEKIKEKITG